MAWKSTASAPNGIAVKAPAPLKLTPSMIISRKMTATAAES